MKRQCLDHRISVSAWRWLPRYSCLAQIPAARDVVKPSAFASFDPVARGKEMEIAVVMKIRDGYHVNARETYFRLFDSHRFES